MAGRKKKGKKRPGVADLVPDRVTTEQYCQAWELFTAGTTPKQIRRIVGLTGAQFYRLYREGLPRSGGRRKALVGFEQRLAEEQAAIRSEAVEAGKAISHVGVRVLAGAMDNALTAQKMLDMIFQIITERMTQQLALPPDEQSSVGLLVSPRTIQVIRTLDAVGNRYRDAAAAYKLIYDDPVAVHPATRGALNLAGRTAGQAALPGAGKDSLPAALAFLDGVDGDGTAAALLEDMAKEVLSWTPEQRKHFGETGEEPDPADVPDPSSVIDVTPT